MSQRAGTRSLWRNFILGGLISAYLFSGCSGPAPEQVASEAGKSIEDSTTKGRPLPRSKTKHEAAPKARLKAGEG